MITDNDQDLFICGKCRVTFSELTIFLTHRTTCDGQHQSCILDSNINTSPPSSSLVQQLDAIVHDVSLAIPSASDLYFEPISVPNSLHSSDFDLLFQPSSVKQVTDTNELLNSNVSDLLQMDDNVPSIEQRMSKMSLLECPVCDEQFDASAVLENHVFEHSTWIDEDEGNNPSMNIFGFSFDDSTLSFDDHQCKQFHCLHPVFRCLNNTCAQLFDKPIDYILHARIHNQKSSINSRRLSRLNTIHHHHRRRKRTHRCSICKKLFSSIESLQHHTKFETHTFDCQLCPAVFDTNNSYHNHIAQHGEIRLYRCTVCIESFEKRTDLSRHVLTQHNDDLLAKQKSCLSCKLTFKTSFHLNRHNVTKHSNIKPFKCEENGCQQAFARKDKLKQHAAKHNASGGLYKCQICVKTFVRPEHLRDHDIVRHSRQYPFQCEYCRKGFLHQNQLYAHHKQRHSTTNINDEDKSFFSFPSQTNHQQQQLQPLIVEPDDSNNLFL